MPIAKREPTKIRTSRVPVCAAERPHMGELQTSPGYIPERHRRPKVAVRNLAHLAGRAPGRRMDVGARRRDTQAEWSLQPPERGTTSISFEHALCLRLRPHYQLATPNDRPFDAEQTLSHLCGAKFS